MNVGDLATLLGGIGSLLGGLTSSVALAIGFFRISQRERGRAAESAAERAMDELLDAVADGQVTAEELEQVRRTLRHEEGGERREHRPEAEGGLA